MDSRRLIKFGKNSFVISLPKDWINENKLKKGDLIFLDNETDELKLLPNKKEYEKELKKTIIEVKNKPIKRIKTEIVAAYLTNSHIIEIKGKLLHKQAKQIKEIVRNLSGLEIMELSSDKIIAQDLLDETDVSIKDIIRRVDMMTRSMLDDAVISLEKDYYETLFYRDMDINRLVYMSYRVMRFALGDPRIAKEMGVTPIDILQNWMIILHIEKLSDQTKRIARSAKKMKIKQKDLNELKDIFKKIKQEYLNAMKAFYTKDIDLAHKTIEENREIITKCNRFSEKHKDYILTNITEFLRIICSASKHIARSVISSGSW